MSDEHGTTIVEAPTASLEEREQVHPVVGRALAALGDSPDPEMLSKLLDLQERYESGQARKAYTRALVRLKGDLPAVIGHDAKVNYPSKDETSKVKYTHTSLAGAMAVVDEHLVKHGFAVSWHPSTDRDGVSVTCRLTHGEGHFEETTLAAAPDKSGGKNSVQAIGSTITYLTRYATLSLLGIATADMKDPEPREQPDDAVAPGRNMRAAGTIATAGRSVEDAVKLIGRPVPEWTGADLRVIRDWLEPPDHIDTADGGLTPEQEAQMEADIAARDAS